VKCNEVNKFVFSALSHALSRSRLHTQIIKTPFCKTTILLRIHSGNRNYVSHKELEELKIPQDGPWEQTLDKIGESDSKNPHINWINKEDPDELCLVEVIAAMSEKDIEYDDDNTSNSVDWKPLVPKKL
jgi:hypothetical protein